MRQKVVIKGRNNFGEELKAVVAADYPQVLSRSHPEALVPLCSTEHPVIEENHHSLL